MKKLECSPELLAMLARPRLDHSLAPTEKRSRLTAIANRKLAKVGFFKPKTEAGSLPAEACGTHGLRPTWHGRAS